jgi:hypothetical protein
MLAFIVGLGECNLSLPYWEASEKCKPPTGCAGAWRLRSRNDGVMVDYAVRVEIATAIRTTHGHEKVCPSEQGHAKPAVWRYFRRSRPVWLPNDPRLR